jgi:hypothetical protein
MAVPSGIMAPCMGQLVMILITPLDWAVAQPAQMPINTNATPIPTVRGHFIPNPSFLR